MEENKRKTQQHAQCRRHLDSQRSWIDFQLTSSAGNVVDRQSVKCSDESKSERTVAERIVSEILQTINIGLRFAFLLARQHVRDLSLPCEEFEAI